MKKTIPGIYEKLGITSQRTQNISYHVGISFFLKIGSTIANFLLVPLTISYLNTENYGVWLTISSVLVWFSLFDIGLGNGLRNKFAESKALGNTKLVQAYVSSAYFTVGVISIILITVFFVINPYLNWNNIFNTSSSLKSDLKILMPVIFTFFGMQLTSGLISSIYSADQHHSIQGKIQFFTQAVLLSTIWLLTRYEDSSLLVYGAIFSAIPVFILLSINFFAFNNKYKMYRPSFRLWKKKYIKDIMGLGFNFFIIQIAALVLFSTDNYIISRIFSPADVVPYNIAYKYFSIVTIAFTIITTPFWSTFTEAYTIKDIKWIKRSVKNIQKLWLIIPFGLVIMILVSQWFYNLWIGDSVTVPNSLTLAMAFFVLLLTFNMIYVNFINGVGKIKIQLITSIIVMIINIPISILFAKTFDLGITGIILGTCLCLLSSVILFPIQYVKIINNRAEGIWNR